MSSTYGSLQKAADAKAFASTRFGKHYIERLKMLRDVATDESRDPKQPSDYAAKMAVKAGAYAKEIDYFHIAQTIDGSKAIKAKLKKKQKEVADKKV